MNAGSITALPGPEAAGQARAPAAGDPAAVYRRCIASEQAARAVLRRGHARLVQGRIAGLAATVAGAVVGLGLAPAWWLAGGAALFIALTVAILGAEARIRRRDRRIAYHEAGLARIEERWIDAGERGDRFVDPQHLYASDLDLFGRGGLFGLLCQARTEAGQATLAAWLKAPASEPDVVARQAAVRELAGDLELRAQLWECGDRIRSEVNPDRLTGWLEAPAQPAGPGVRLVAAILGAAALPALWLAVSGQLALAAALAAAQAGVAYRQRKLTAEVTRSAARRAWELQTVVALVDRLERARFTSPLLVALQRALDGHPLRARRRVGRLIWWVELLEARHNLYFAITTAPLLLGTQLALAIEAWRHRHGGVAARWVAAVAEIEALASLATFCFEHPGFAFPHVIADARRPVLTAEAIAHPLLPAATRVANDVDLGAVRMLLITGSNMSGKSTLLRTVGINSVLAFAGAPVCARALALSPLAIGGTIRTHDSLHEGVSRFFAEIRRLRGIVALAEQSPFTLVLLDEILAGTNSHDRQRGGEAIVRTLVERGAIGLVTTHDLSLARIADPLAPRVASAHFQDRIEGDKLVFDFTLRPGIVQRSNALDLMRLVGLEV